MTAPTASGELEEQIIMLIIFPPLQLLHSDGDGEDRDGPADALRVGGGGQLPVQRN